MSSGYIIDKAEEFRRELWIKVFAVNYGKDEGKGIDLSTSVALSSRAADCAVKSYDRRTKDGVLKIPEHLV